MADTIDITPGGKNPLNQIAASFRIYSLGFDMNKTGQNEIRALMMEHADRIDAIAKTHEIVEKQS